MINYTIPKRDMMFVLFELLDYEQHLQSLSGPEALTRDVVEAIVDECGKFCENVIAPLNSSGDKEGCHWQDGVVTTPKGFKEAYQQYVAGGWPSMTHPVEYGGQGLPVSMETLVSDMVGAANWAWGMYPGLSHGAMHTLSLHGTDEQKATYLTKLVAGEWTGTMCLTESHCGTDLGMLRTKAEPQADGSYRISGSKIFISAGEHDLTENIVHIVLARIPGAPEGTKGISLFIVPKFLPDAAGAVGLRNAVSCASIEHKMGIHANATCVLNFDGATGFLIGEPNRGLHYMFTFMNNARLGTAVQGLSHAQLGFQKSLSYAKERLQSRSLSGVKNPAGPADPIIVHPDVRRMLLTQKAMAEGGRMLAYSTALLVDKDAFASDEDQRKEASELLALLTPIAKAFMTETGFECASLALQCFGGHGYIQEWGVEQNLRDSRIAMLYEGTTGIQALDLLGRKILMTQGESLKRFTKIIHKYCKSQEGNDQMAEFIEPLAAKNKEWGELTLQIGMKAMSNPDEVGAAAVDYLMYSGLVTFAYWWARAAEIALNKQDEPFYAAKLTTARFFYQRLLPRTLAHAAAMKTGVDGLLALDAEHFSFD
ncbi:MAG TPA: acyl-CoA dehydrogenase C-terminal domain-containing protein [Cellvibrionaceae bacterium]|nr:acyl-CoA dehydrogenase C-terminal domain-containing protein [Cellvibrionaceae bacterium]